MFVKSTQKALAAGLALWLAGLGGAAWAADAPSSVDMGLAASGQPVHVTLILKLNHEAALQDYIRQTVTPGSPHYRRFLGTAEFAQRYGASDAQIQRVQAYLRQHGVDSQVLPNHLAIETTGTLAQYGAIFQAPIHSFVAPGSGRRYHEPVAAPQMPAALADSVVFASGLSDERQFLSHRVREPRLPVALQPPHAPDALARSAGKPAGNPTASGNPGQYTVGDVANLYNINPLYRRGIDGKGSTVGVVTLSNFYPADAQAYWDGIGLATKPNRITQVHVDGGGAFDDGSGETALDVEQSGGLAPFADIIVYDAPNSGNGFTDALARAVSDNRADSISISWGLPEIFNFAALNVDGASVTDTTDVGNLRSFHELLMEAAAQGQSVFAAAGDSGAYDTVRGLGDTQFNTPLTVDSPASDPYITAAGGTTVPFSFQFGSGPVATISKEQVWGWDYLSDYLDANLPRPGGWRSAVFSTGTGGGVSVYWSEPFYQWFTRGIQRSERGQTLAINDPAAGAVTLLQLPGHFRGRNVPDISLNADPYSGYIVVSSTDGGVVAEGGTSFVAPQLNGISALLTQSTGHRVGFWNPQVYLLQNIFGYGPWSPFRSVDGGDNWFYHGAAHYTPGAGIGTLDVDNLNLFLGGR